MDIIDEIQELRYCTEQKTCGAAILGDTALRFVR
jgi:hypothetical protein